METVAFDFDIISDRAKQIAYLNKGLRITIENIPENIKISYCFEGGLIEYVKELNKN